MTLSPVISRALALTLLVALVWAANAFAVQPLLERQRFYDNAIADHRELERRYLRLGASLPALEARLAEVGERVSPAGLFLAAASDALVAAELQNRVKSVVEAAGGRLTSTQILPARDEGNFRRVGIRVQLTATTEPLQRILYELEAATPYLFVENTDIRRRVTRRRRRGERDVDVESDLTVRFDLLGYTRAEAS